MSKAIGCWLIPAVLPAALAAAWPSHAPVAAATQAATAPPATQPTTSTRATQAMHIMQILRDNCVSCHNPDKKKANLLLTSREAALKGNDDGPVLVPGRSAESRLAQALLPDADPHMPPKKQLSPEEIAAVRAWIEAGAPWDERALAEAPAGGAATRPVALHALPAAYHPVLALALSPDGKALAVGRGSRVVIHDLTQPGRPVRGVLDGAKDAVQSLTWSPDGRRLAAGHFERITIWDVRDDDADKPPLELGGLSGRVTALQFLHGPQANGSSDAPGNGLLLAADGGAGRPARIHLFRLPDTRPQAPVEPQATVEAHADTIFALRCSPDGSVLASAAADKLVKLWEPTTLKELARLEGHTGHVLALAFKADGSLLASGGTDKDVKVWDLKTREQKATIGPHPAAVTALAWGDGGQGIVATTEDGAALVDAESGPRPGRPLAAAEDVLYCVTATPDGKTVFGGCHDGRVYVWAGGRLEGRLAEPASATSVGSSKP